MKKSITEEILGELDRKVIGHDKAKKMLINLINKSMLKYQMKYLHLNSDADNIIKTNSIMVGHSGIGKTHLIKSLSDILCFPLLVIDATELNPTGAGGGIKKEGLTQLIKNTAQIFAAEHPYLYYSVDGAISNTFVFVDEVDKLAKAYDSSGNWNRQVQANFLTIFDSKEHPFDDVCYIFAGAFDGMLDSKKETSIGFNSSETKADPYIEDTDLIKYGLIPELVGRCGSVIHLKDLAYEEYKKIIYDVLIPGKNKELEVIGAKKVKLTHKKIDAIITSTLKSGQGVRHLKRQVDELFLEAEFNAAHKGIEYFVNSILNVETKMLENDALKGK